MGLNKYYELQRTKADHPFLSPFVILKISMICYGVVLTERALNKVQEPMYCFGKLEPFGISFSGRTNGRVMPGPILLRDASNVYINYGELYTDPYVVDWDPDLELFILKEDEKIIDIVDFVPRPRFYGKTTSKGTPMEQLAEVRAQKLIMNAFQRCRLWEKGNQCAFCAFFTGQHINGEVDCQDIYETVNEALKEPGRFSEIFLSGGTDFGGETPFEEEIKRYISVFQAIGRNFKGHFSSQLMAPAYKKKDLQRIYNETGVTSYCPNIEIWDEKLFPIMCPGKEKWIGRNEWINRTIAAVEVFGRGKVYTQVVAGVELSRPHGFKTMSEALNSNFEACEFFAKNGVIYLSTIWRPHKSTKLGYQPMPPMEYYIRLTEGLHQIRKEYGLVTTNDNYKHCGNHPDSDQERLD
ncbi:MAG: hypothetical protein PHE29_14365 [Tissierellia bacterium]|nr:hypothetical protein [Tissierellia bacterium]MDD4780700.1 hypothetical protein [Tissierellia bacterium]